MKKRLLTAIVSIALLASLNCQALAVDQNEAELLLDTVISDNIFNKYAEEIQSIEEDYGVQINEYTDKTNNLLKQAARDAYNTEQFERRSQLITELAIVKDEQDILNASEVQGITITPRNLYYAGTKVIKNYGPIKGEVLATIAPGISTTQTIEETIGIDSGEEIADITFSSSVSLSVSTTTSGPEEDATLANGKKATHRLVTGILYGVIVEREYMYVDPWTGAQLGDPFYEYDVIDEDGLAYSHLAQISTPTYVEKATTNSCVRDSDYRAFKEHLRTDPGDFI